MRHSHFATRTFPGTPVIHEESIKTYPARSGACPELGRRVVGLPAQAGATKAPDHTFRTPRPRRKLRQDWAGGLREFRDKCTSLELQKKALE